jgi:hypothetical protein
VHVAVRAARRLAAPTGVRRASRALAAVAGAAALIAGGVPMAGCSSSEDEPAASSEETNTAGGPPPPPVDSEPRRVPEDEPGPGRREREVREVSRAVDRYVRAIDRRDGAGVCRLLLRGSLDVVEMPRAGGGCAESVGASIGFRDPRGIPVFDHARVAAIDSVEVSGRRARATATVIVEFSDRDEPSVEDDVIYLSERGGEWLVARPSATLYRAIGAANLPAQALAPPG